MVVNPARGPPLPPGTTGKSIPSNEKVMRHSELLLIFPKAFAALPLIWRDGFPGSYLVQAV